LNEGVKPSLLKGDIQFRNVAFRYPARPEQTVRLFLNLQFLNLKIIIRFLKIQILQFQMEKQSRLSDIPDAEVDREIRMKIKKHLLKYFPIESTILSLITRLYDPDLGQV